MEQVSALPKENRDDLPEWHGGKLEEFPFQIDHVDRTV